MRDSSSRGKVGPVATRVNGFIFVKLLCFAHMAHSNYLKIKVQLVFKEERKEMMFFLILTFTLFEDGADLRDLGTSFPLDGWGHWCQELLSTEGQR